MVLDVIGIAAAGIWEEYACKWGFVFMEKRASNQAYNVNTEIAAPQQFGIGLSAAGKLAENFAQEMV